MRTDCPEKFHKIIPLMKLWRSGNWIGNLLEMKVRPQGLPTSNYRNKNELAVADKNLDLYNNVSYFVTKIIIGRVDMSTQPNVQTWRLPPSTSRSALLDAGGGDASFRRLIYDILTMSANFERIRERMAATLGLTGIQYHILMAVAEVGKGKPVTVSAIADHLHITGAYVTMETRKLARMGLVDKCRNPDDRRSVLLSLTDDGGNKLEGFAPQLREINDTLFCDIGPKTFRQFCSIVDHMRRTSDRTADLAEHLAQWGTPNETIAAIRR